MAEEQQTRNSQDLIKKYPNIQGNDVFKGDELAQEDNLLIAFTIPEFFFGLLWKAKLKKEIYFQK